MKKYLPFLLFFCTYFCQNQAQAQTYLSGTIISTNATWTKNNSPYIIQDSIYIADNVELMIEAGTHILLEENAKILVGKATMSAIGTKSDSIFIGFGNIMVSNIGKWKGIYLQKDGAKLDFKYCFGNNSNSFVAPTEANVSCNFENCTFELNDFVLNQKSKVGNYIFTNCLLENNKIGIIGANKVENCIFKNHSIYAISPFGKMENNEFTQNEIAVSGSFSAANGCTFLYNYLHKNKIGIEMDSFQNGVPFHYNRICNNTIYNLYKKNNENSIISIPNNCWCTSDSAAIEIGIWDIKDDANLAATAQINFMPILNDCSQQPPIDTTQIPSSFLYLSNNQENTITIKSIGTTLIPILSAKIINLSGQVVYWEVADNQVNNIWQYVNCICQSLAFEKTISLDFLPKGIYLLQVNTEKITKIIRW